ncbi:MAG: ComEC/Rec2 family competence protein [Oscillospiraceae bacterium]|nr:ComEC/Rec2 family competence protein [Oscillospiraceae bacterium]
MIRPFFVFGLTEFLSLLLFRFAGIKTAVISGAVSLTAYIFLILYKRNFKIKIYLKSISAFILISAILFSGEYYCVQVPAQSLADDSAHSLSGEIFDEAKESYGKYYYYIKLSEFDGEKTNVKVRFSSSDYYKLDIGGKIKIDNATVYKLGRYTDGVYIGAYSSSAPDVSNTDTNAVYSFISKVRSHITNTLFNNMPTDTASLCTALLTGNTQSLPQSFISSFRYSGVSHLFAVSGLHLTIWTSLLFILLDKILGNKRRLKAVISTLFIVFFMFLTGFSRSVMRAGVMLLLYNAGTFSGKKADSINSLFFALCVILSYDVNLCTDVSLLMSFFSCLGLVIYAPKLNNLLGVYIREIKFKPAKIILNFVNSSVCVSLSASLFTLITSSIFFGTFSAISPVTNLIAVPLGEGVMLCSALGIILSFIGAQSIMFIIANILSKTLIFVTDKLSMISECTVNMTNDLFLYIASAVFICFLIVLFIKSGSEKIVRNAGIIAMSVIFLCGISSQFTALNDNSITVSSTGECISAVFKFKGGNVSAVSSADAKTSDYSPISSILGRRETDVLILDSESDSASSYLSTAVSQISARFTIISPSVHDPALLRSSETVNKSDACSVNIGNGAETKYIKNENDSYIYFKSPEYSCVMILDSDSVSSCPESADVLIVRGDILDYIDLSQFRCIIVVSPDDETLAGQRKENVYFTEHNDTVTVRNGEVK